MSNVSLTYLLADIGAAIAQHTNAIYTSICAAVAVVVTIAMLIDFYRNRSCGPIVLAAVCLTLIHPIWTISGISGDLGFNQKRLAIISTSLIVGLMFAMFIFGKTAPTENLSNDPSDPLSGSNKARNAASRS